MIGTQIGGGESPALLSPILSAHEEINQSIVR
jgi:hypothetical protein